jgi:hypothetical protein
VCCALVGAGCGSDDKKDESKPAISKATFIAKADAICKRGDNAIEKAGNAIFSKDKNPPKAVVEKFATDTVAKQIQGEIDDIRALGAPAGDEKTIDAMLADVQDGVDLIKSKPSTINENDTPAPFKAANAKAKAYGLKKCGED